MKTKKIIKILILVIVLAALAVGGFFAYKFFFKKTTVEESSYQVKKETYENVIEISGTVAAAQEQTLQALSAGTVLGVYVKAGDRVKKGDVLIQLDDTTEQYNLEKHDYDMATKRITGSPKEIKLMETQRLSLVQKIADRKVVATFDGVIADLDVAVGASLEAKDSVGTIVNIDYLTAEVEIAETDVAKLKVNQPVILDFPAYKNASVEGYVVSWPAIGEVTSRGATIVKAKIRIDDYPDEILPNFSFTGKIQIEAPVEYLLVSKFAVGFEDKQAYVVEEKSGEKIPVKIRPYGSEYVKILEGVKEGTWLKQVTVPPKSGQNKDRNNSGKGGNDKPGNGMPNGAPGGNFGGGMPPRVAVEWDLDKSF